MRKEIISNGKSYKKPKMGILIGIPLLLFICGVTLITVGSYNYLKSAFYLSSLFIHDEYKPQVQVKSSSAAPVNKIRFPKFGEKFGDIIIDSVSLNVPVFNGDNEEQLLKGAGHFNGSRFPGEGGNVVLAGHRNSVFKKLKDVAAGDLMTLNTTYGKYVYKISEIKIVDGNDQSIIQPMDSEKLTLYTCYPFNYIGHAPKRYVVIGDLVEGTTIEELMKKGVSN